MKGLKNSLISMMTNWPRQKKVLKQFEIESGWKGKGRHLMTLASFALELLEHSEFTFDPKIQKH